MIDEEKIDATPDEDAEELTGDDDIDDSEDSDVV